MIVGRQSKQKRRQNNAAMSTHSIACAVRPKLRSLEKGVGGGLETGIYTVEWPYGYNSFNEANPTIHPNFFLLNLISPLS